MKKLFLMILSLVATIFCLFAVGCGLPDFLNPNGGNTQEEVQAEVDAELTQWANTSSSTCDYFTSRKLEVVMVSCSDGVEYLPFLEVFDSKGEGVAVIGNAFDVEDLDGYTVKYTINAYGKKYVKTVNLSVNIPDPFVFFGEYEEYYKGVYAYLPEIVVLDANGESIEYTYKLKAPNGEDVAIENARFRPTVSGDYTLSVEAVGMNENPVSLTETLSVQEIAVGVDVELQNSKKNNGWYSAEGVDFATDIYGNKAIDINSADVVATALDLGMSLEELKATFDYVEFTLCFYGDGSAAYLRYVPNGVNIKTQHYERGERAYLDFWQSHTFQIATENFDGNIYTQAVWSDQTKYQIALVKAVGCFEKSIEVSEYSEQAIQSVAYEIPSAKYYIRDVEQEEEVSLTVKLNGNIVETNGSTVTFEEAGQAELIYSVGKTKKVVTISVIDMYKIDLEAYAKEALLGNKVYAPEAFVWNKVTEDKETGKAISVSATFNGENVDITNGFIAEEVGMLEITYSADDCNDVTATIVFATEVTLKEMTTDYFTTNATVKTVTYPGWDAFSIKNQTVDVIWFRTHNTYTVTFNEDFVAEAKGFETLTFYICLWDSGWGINLTANGATSTLSGNGDVTFTFATADWDGTMTITVKNPTWGGGQHDESTGYNICITKVVGSN